jgi:regulator of nucleoside diphosphate kinase
VLSLNKREVTIMKRNIHMTSIDLERLSVMVEKAKYSATKEKMFYLEALESELKKATILASQDIPDTIVTMNSLVRLVDLNHDEEMICSLVYPEEADIINNKLSILAPIGTAIIGYSVGDTVEWEVPEGIIKLLIKEIIYQPEANGHFQL